MSAWQRDELFWVGSWKLSLPAWERDELFWVGEFLLSIWGRAGGFFWVGEFLLQGSGLEGIVIQFGRDVRIWVLISCVSFSVHS